MTCSSVTEQSPQLSLPPIKGVSTKRILRVVSYSFGISRNLMENSSFQPLLSIIEETKGMCFKMHTLCIVHDVVYTRVLVLCDRRHVAEAVRRVEVRGLMYWVHPGDQAGAVFYYRLWYLGCAE